MPKPLTKRQSDVLKFIKKFIDKNGCSPTQKEIADHFGVFPNAARDYLINLQKKGEIVFTSLPTRNIKLAKKDG